MTNNPEQAAVEFKPCPVCGQQPKWRGSATDYRAGIYRLQCIGETHLFQSYGATEAICIAAWNTRTEASLRASDGAEVELTRLYAWQKDQKEDDEATPIAEDRAQGGAEESVERLKDAPGSLYGAVGVEMFRADFAGLKAPDAIALVGNAAWRWVTEWIARGDHLAALSSAPDAEMQVLRQSHDWLYREKERLENALKDIASRAHANLAQPLPTAPDAGSCPRTAVSERQEGCSGVPPVTSEGADHG